ncbi:MAG: hypothetical protein AB1649_32960 [Chloroflexota bacterium]
MAKTMSEFNRIELQSTLSLMKDIYTLRTSILSALAVANVSVIGFAINSQIATAFLLGCLITAVAIIMEGIIGKLYLSVLYRGVQLTEEYSPTKESLFSVIITTTQPEKLHKHLEEICHIKDRDQRRHKLAETGRSLGRFQSARSRLLTSIWIIALIAQFLAVPILYFLFQWRLV